MIIETDDPEQARFNELNALVSALPYHRRVILIDGDGQAKRNAEN
jgi:hypothetical protein